MAGGKGSAVKVASQVEASPVSFSTLKIQVVVLGKLAAALPLAGTVPLDPSLQI
jgi:hypothetical protein